MSSSPARAACSNSPRRPIAVRRHDRLRASTAPISKAPRASLSRHINAHGQVLESIHAAVAIYGADKRLNFFNSAFARLWGIEEDWLAGEPSLDELLERLRERRRVPEYADFRAFKRQQLAMFTSLIEPQSELLHLPDERTLSVSVSPHPFGGLIFVYEDVTDRLALERSYNTLIEVQRETLDNLFEGIAVFGSDGRLKLHNPAYRTIWGLTESRPRRRAAFRRHRREDPGFLRRRRRLAGDCASGSSPRSRRRRIASGRLDRRDGSVLQLRDGAAARRQRAARPTSTSPTPRGSSARCASATRRWKPPDGSRASSSPTSPTSCARR